MKNHLQQIIYKNVKINILRLDTLHPIIQGNKFYKLKYNILKAKENKCSTLLTFGGEFSNHIHATALAGVYENFKTIGVIRGNEPKNLNYTLREVLKNGMELYYLNRTDYRKIREYLNQNNIEKIIELLNENNIHFESLKTYIIPEGGTNQLALKGATEILNNIAIDYKTVCLPVGSAGTIAGIISGSKIDIKIIGFPALKGNFFEKEIKRLILPSKKSNWLLKQKYHFGGFAAFNDILIQFINNFYKEFNIPICPLYTGKMFFGIFDMIDKKMLKNDDKVLAIHTGGLQGIKGFNEKNGFVIDI